ncbi:HNH endonuclease [Bradyrhizobium tropiciagri]|uniref:HNH endonuclease n=1 Tax=Bradyrhizobium tropiciagri TaxID=312253 RepID=UPI00067D345C|nr:HNH endonuclease [Bradyrhizobium tropiciagri]
MRRYVSNHNYRGNPRAIERTELRRGTIFTMAEKRDYGIALAVRDGGWICFYCKAELDSGYHIDHKLPVARGGSHSMKNFALACMPCNQEKHAKDIDEYREWRRDRGLSVLF